ncbi:MAG: radical SAM protein [Elusimicrobia bacterium]|nr:radical SAM protein [Elusimicrobiota bacterium]
MQDKQDLETPKKLIIERSFQDAIVLLRGILARQPENDSAMFELGKALYMMGNHAVAVEHLHRSLSINHANMNACVLLAKCYKELNEPRLAIEYYQRVAVSNSAGENVDLELSALHMGLGEYERAFEYLRKARASGYDPQQYERDILALYERYLKSIQQSNFDGDVESVLRDGEILNRILSADDYRLRNSVLNEMEIARHSLRLDSTMRSLTIVLTNKCNLACLMCETRKKPWDLPEAAKKEVMGLMPSLDRIMWQGGEVFLYEGFEELLDEAAKYKLRQVIITNGTLLDERIAEKLVRYNVELTFSIDGATKEVYEHIRPNATFEKVLANVALINTLRKQLNPLMQTRLNVLIMRANFHQIEQFVEFAQLHEFNNLFFNSSGCDFKNISENIFYGNQDADIVKHISSIRDVVSLRAIECGVKLENWLPSASFFEDMSKGVKNSDAPASSLSCHTACPLPDGLKGTQKSKLFCHAPWQRLYIDNGGFVRPDCLCRLESSIGNLKTESLADMWNGEKMIACRDGMLHGTHTMTCNNDCVFGRVPEKNLKYI